ncbi:MAG: flagellar export protein FliJ [Gammaproteobacteria bacterium]|nr:flagellar export protein FliJ [Gammaproteobacteria bacterium]
MKSNSQRIDPVKRVAQQREQNAAETLSKVQASYGQAQAKLHELVQYRTDYLAEFQYRAKKGMSGSQLQHYKSFLLQLEKAIETQQRQIELLQGQVSQQRKEWQSRNQRSQAVDKYQQKLKQKEIADRDRKEARRLEDDLNNLNNSVKQ